MEIAQGHIQAQSIAKQTMEFIRNQIRPGMELAEIRRLCEAEMIRLGADSFWYYDVGAFCFAGDQTALSVSGRQYQTADRRIQREDLITIDLSPQIGGRWGDYARTIVLQEGKVVRQAADVQNEEWRSGLLTEELLRQELRSFARPEISFHQLYEHFNRLIEKSGFVNLDFLGNLGHTIVQNKAERVFIEQGAELRLGEAGLFTFEPHIGRPGSVYGYKREDIYYFDEKGLQQL